ncbi:MAG: arginase [Legionellales bacterium]|nr:arginase [Legionellales bacterium]
MNQKGMSRNCSIPTVGYAYGHASRDPRVSEGPYCIQSNTQNTQALNWIKIIEAPKAQHQHIQALDDVVYCCTQLAETIHAIAQTQKPFLMIGGDHSCAIGTWHGAASAYHQPIGLIWIDAHLDSHTFKSSPSQNIHGMPLAALLGHGHSSLTELKHTAPVIQPEHLTLIGATSYEPEESELLNTLNVQVHPLSTIQHQNPTSIIQTVVDAMTQAQQPFGISLDLDVFDPHLAPAVTTYAELGLDISSTLTALQYAAQSPYFIGLEIAEFTPANDLDHITEHLVMKIISHTFGVKL